MMSHVKPLARCAGALVMGALCVLLFPPPSHADQKTFARPEDAARALVEAARANDEAALITILGPGSEDIVTTGDPVQDRNTRARVAAAAKERTWMETLPSGAVIAHLGTDDWPLPIPLVADGERWRFDTAAAREEILNRHIGNNEIKAIYASLAYAGAQRQYARTEKVFAQWIRSEPGKRDGLYWNDPTGKHPSPLGPLFAEATTEGYALETPGEPQPYHGYFFRVLTTQGPHGPGGTRSYVKDGRMVGGFALVAYPAAYGASGIMTFIVGPQGVVYQKNLGDKTAEIAKAMTAYDPDESWMPVRD